MWNFSPWLCRIPCAIVPHWRPRAAMSRLMPILLKPYFRKKVMRKPIPANTITCTSWKTAKEQRKKNLHKGTTEKVLHHSIFHLLSATFFSENTTKRMLTGLPKAGFKWQLGYLAARRPWANYSVSEPFLGRLCTIIPVCLSSSPWRVFHYFPPEENFAKHSASITRSCRLSQYYQGKLIFPLVFSKPQL